MVARFVCCVVTGSDPRSSKTLKVSGLAAIIINPSREMYTDTVNKVSPPTRIEIKSRVMGRNIGET